MRRLLFVLGLVFIWVSFADAQIRFRKEQQHSLTTYTDGVHSVTGTWTVNDTGFVLRDDADTTKRAQFQISAITTATTRTFTLPDVTDTLVSLTATQNLTNKTLTAPVLSGTASGTYTLGGTPTLGSNLIFTAGNDIRPTANSTTAINIAQADGTDFVTFDTTDRFVGINVTPTVRLHVVDPSDINTLMLEAYKTAQAAALLQTRRARGTQAAPTALILDDTIFELQARGHDGTNWIPGAAIRMAVDGGVSASDMPGRMLFLTTPDASDTPAERMRITEAGLVGVNRATPGAQLGITAGAAGTIGLIVDTAASPTAPVQRWRINGTNAAHVDLSASLTDISATSRDLGNNTAGPRYTVGRNLTAGAEGPVNGAIFWAGNTADSYVWADQSRVLRINSAAPTGSTGTPTVSETGGTVVGTQTSWWKLKENIILFVDYHKALATVVNTPLYSFDMSGQHYDAGYVIHEADVGKWFSWNDDLEKQQIPALNERQLFGYLAASIKALNAKIERLEAKIQ